MTTEERVEKHLEGTELYGSGIFDDNVTKSEVIKFTADFHRQEMEREIEKELKSYSTDTKDRIKHATNFGAICALKVLLSKLKDNG
jgi:hypothetical protein